MMVVKVIPMVGIHTEQVAVVLHQMVEILLKTIVIINNKVVDLVVLQ